VFCLLVVTIAPTFSTFGYPVIQTVAKPLCSNEINVDNPQFNNYPRPP
jgi:hypothetical protein